MFEIIFVIMERLSVLFCIILLNLFMCGVKLKVVLNWFFLSVRCLIRW